VALALGATRTRSIYNNKKHVQTVDVISNSTANVAHIPLSSVHDNVSHTDLQPPSAERQKQLGMCSVCFRQLSITSSSVIHSHGLNGQCAGSGHAPVDGSITVVKAPTYNLQHSQPATGDSFNSVIEMTTDDLLHRLRDDMNNCRLLKRIPKATRTVAAEKLAQ